MKHATLVLISVLLVACSPTQLLTKALINDEKQDAIAAEKYKLERDKYTAFFCIHSAPLQWNTNDNPYTIESIKQHNMKWEVLCKQLQSELQQNNQELEAINRGYPKMRVMPAY